MKNLNSYFLRILKQAPLSNKGPIKNVKNLKMPRALIRSFTVKVDIKFNLRHVLPTLIITRIAYAYAMRVIITTQGKASYEGMFVTSGVISAKRKYVESVTV